MRHFYLLLPLFLMAATSTAQSKAAHPPTTTGVKATAYTDSLSAKGKDTAVYATLYFYRAYVPKMVAPMKKVPIYFNDSLLHNLKANTLVAFKVTKEGRYRIATDEKGENLLPIRIKMGQEYFFKCDIEAGLWFGKPTIQPVTPKIGRAESGVLEEEKTNKTER